MASKQGNLMRQARLLARVRYGPEIGALAQLLTEAQSERRQSVSGARAGSDAYIQTLQANRPAIGQIYDQAAQNRGLAQSEAEQAMAGLGGGVVNAIRAARARESAGQAERIGSSRAGALSELSQREVSSRAGAIRDVGEADRRYREDAGKIGERLKGLAQEQGAFIETSFGNLSKQEQDQAIKEANLGIARQRADIAAGTLEESKRSHRATEQTARYKATHPSKGKGAEPKPRFAPKEKTAAKSNLRTLISYGQGSQYAKPGHGLKLVSQINRRAAKAKIPADPLLVRAAAMMVIYRRLDKPTKRKLITNYGIGGP